MSLGRWCSCTASRRYGTRGATRCWPWPPPGTAPSRPTAAATGSPTSRRGTWRPPGRTSSPTCSPSSTPSPSTRYVFLVGKDYGAMPAYDFALRHPDRTRGVMCMGIPFSPGPFNFDTMPEGFYILRWREPDRAEADFGRHDVRRVVRTIYILFSRSDVPIAEEGQEIMDLADLSTPLPPWFTEEDLDAYAALYEKSGFRYPLQIPYRSLHRMTKHVDPKFQVPVFMVMGEKDYCFKFPGFEAAMRSGVMNTFAPNLKITYIPEGSHFVQEQFPDQINDLLLGFLKDHP
ncbi:unnamed protein product [Triticum turgidum subsp. durum]|uniref:AB hydrolase-1 domain-containing protein n=1 Tax=Triticum turgidum subsp. durum TaxID=4567 RepID=A0A9R0Q4S6_TRITD|nr:unnamed protein product [Triticum turgidum subsp. durum]